MIKRKFVTIRRTRNNIDNLSLIHSSTFEIGPLNTGDGTTLGSIIHRQLKSNFYGFGVLGVQILGAPHEYICLPSLKGDILDLVSRLKMLKFKHTFKNMGLDKQIIKIPANFSMGTLISSGPKVLTAGMIQLENQDLEILQPNFVLTTLTGRMHFACNLVIGELHAANLLNTRETNLLVSDFLISRFGEIVDSEIFGLIPVGTTANAIRQANFRILYSPDFRGNLKEYLYFDIQTDGTQTPHRCLLYAFLSLLETILPFVASLSASTFSLETLQILEALES